MSSQSPFRIRKVQVTDRGCRYVTFLVEGYLNGQRVRKKYQDYGEAAAAKATLDIRAGNAESALRLTSTRLSDPQIAEAEFCFRRLGDRASLTSSVEWYLANYRPPANEMDLSSGQAEFIRSKLGLVKPRHQAEVRRQLAAFTASHPGRAIHSIKRAEVQGYLESRKDWGPKSWNNVRGILHSFFDYAIDPDRAWANENPVRNVPQREVPRGLPTVMTAGQVAALFEFLENYTGGTRRPQPPGFLVPYFALATFAGLRPSVPSGEIWKMGHASDRGRLVDVGLGVVRITPEIAKTGSIRQVKMRPNLIAWLKAYPAEGFPLVMTNMSDWVTAVRAKFALSPDVLRHTFISMHVARFKSMGEAALEAGNSEAIIRRHYLNLVSEDEANQFWSIMPGGARSVDDVRHVA